MSARQQITFRLSHSIVLETEQTALRSDIRFVVMNAGMLADRRSCSSVCDVACRRSRTSMSIWILPSEDTPTAKRSDSPLTKFRKR